MKKDRTEYCKNYLQTHKCQIKERAKRYYKAHRKHACEMQKQYREQHANDRLTYSRRYNNQRYHADPLFQIKIRCQSRIRDALKRSKSQKFFRTNNLLGCSIPELKNHLEQRFEQGMTWDNYGEWHIDHIIPCSVFDLSDPVEQKQCFHFTNLQPLWAEDNIAKSDNYSFISTTS